jgi:hypothetical protein
VNIRTSDNLTIRLIEYRQFGPGRFFHGIDPTPVGHDDFSRIGSSLLARRLHAEALNTLRSAGDHFTTSSRPQSVDPALPSAAIYDRSGNVLSTGEAARASASAIANAQTRTKILRLTPPWEKPSNPTVGWSDSKGRLLDVWG